MRFTCAGQAAGRAGGKRGAGRRLHAPRWLPMADPPLAQGSRNPAAPSGPSTRFRPAPAPRRSGTLRREGGGDGRREAPSPELGHLGPRHVPSLPMPLAALTQDGGGVHGGSGADAAVRGHAGLHGRVGRGSAWFKRTEGRPCSAPEPARPTLSRRWIRPTGNCRPARLDRDVGFRLSSRSLDFGPMVPLAPLPAGGMAPRRSQRHVARACRPVREVGAAGQLHPSTTARRPRGAHPRGPSLPCPTSCCGWVDWGWGVLDGLLGASAQTDRPSTFQIFCIDRE
jgi:hypothetical protein